MRAVLVLLFFVLASFQTPRALASPLFLLGEWHQVDSNAGKCYECRITIKRTGADLAVTASNGWSAVVRPAPDGKNGAIGKGVWQRGSGGSYGGRQFVLFLGVIDDRLYMIMQVPKADNRISEIKATFEKAVSNRAA